MREVVAIKRTWIIFFCLESFLEKFGLIYITC